MLLLRSCVVLLLLFALLNWAERAGAANWRPVTPEELKLTAAAIGDPEADAAILFREGELNDNAAEGTNLRIYIRIKISTSGAAGSSTCSSPIVQSLAA